MLTTKSTRLVAITALCVACGEASAVNPNPSFATTTSGWTVESPADATLAWSSTDANGAGNSGSARITNTSAGPSNGAGIGQCVGAVTVGASYTYGGKVLFPTGQATTGSLEVGLRWWNGAGCTGSTVGTQPRLQANSPGASWVALASGIEVAPAGAVSGEFVAFPSKVEAGGQLVGQFDDLYFDDGKTAPPVVSLPPTSIPLLHPALLGLVMAALALLGSRHLRRR